MSFLPKLAIKNLARHRRRTAITASALAVGLAIYILMDSLLLGADRESERNLIWYESSSARVLREGAWEERDRMPLEPALESPEAIIARLAAKGIPAAPRTVFGGELVVSRDPFPEDGSVRVKVIAIDPGRDDKVFRLRETLVSGRFIERGEEAVMLGPWLAEDLGAQVGYTVTIVTRSRDGYYQTISAPIAGILAIPNPVVNRVSAFLPLDVADDLLAMGGAVTEIDLRLPERADADRVAADLKAGLGSELSGSVVLGWKKLAEDYLALAASKKKSNGTILFLVFIIAAVGISNTMLMAIYERVRELGTMRALGMADLAIRRLFLLEAAGIGVLGATLGIALGAALCVWMVNTGIDYSALARRIDLGYRIAGVLRGAWHPEAMAGAFFFGVLLAVAVAFVPTRRVLRMSITDCLRAA